MPPLRVESHGPEVYNVARDANNFPDSPWIAPTRTSAHPAPSPAQGSLSVLFGGSTESDVFFFHDLLIPSSSQNSVQLPPMSFYVRACEFNFRHLKKLVIIVPV